MGQSPISSLPCCSGRVDGTPTTLTSIENARKAKADALEADLDNVGEDSDEDDSDDEMDEEQELAIEREVTERQRYFIEQSRASDAGQVAAAQRLSKLHRPAVMSERWVPEEGWKPPVNQKTSAQRERIKKAVERPAAFMFHGLNPGELATVISAFKEHDLSRGEQVIRQGHQVGPDEPGLFVIESGELDVYKSMSPQDGIGNKVTTYVGAGQFGELALLYNAPRAATVVAKTNAVVWSIDRNTFNYCVKDATVKRSQRNEQFLASVEILQSLTAAERAKISDILHSATYNEGDEIITEGTDGNTFFIIEEGKAFARKEGIGVVKEYGVADYFGELALLNQTFRQATVVAKVTPTRVLTLDGQSFTRLLGSLSMKLRENAAKRYVGLKAGPKK